MDEKKKLQELFLEKKYSEIISIIENTEVKSAGLLNLLGVCRLLITDHSAEGITLANSIFKEAYFKEKNSQFGLDALVNFINTSIELYDRQFDISNDYFFKEKIDQCILYFTEAEKIFKNNTALILSIIRLYKRLGYQKKILFYQKKLIDNNFKDPKLLCSYIYRQCFDNIWKQKDFFDFAKILNASLKKYPDNKLIEINNKNLKIRLGFLSSDLKDYHSITYFFKSILKNYDKDKFEIFLFTNNKNLDDISNEIIDLVSVHQNISKLSDIEAINTIRGSKIDVMFDLMGVTSSNRLILFKNRIARIQVTWLGYCNTTGVENIDYIISDHNLIKNDEQNLYSEKVLFLPKIWSCHSGFKNHSYNNQLPFKRNNHITFGSFNNFNKINENVIKIWAQILKNTDSKLILKSSLKIETTNLIDLFKKYGVLNSIEFQTYRSFDDHLNLYNEVDIALDTFPYNGVTTSFEAFWMGVPVLTMKGYNFNSRCGESIVKNLGLDYLIANNETDYISKAIELTKNIKNLEKIRNEIFMKAKHSPLFDSNTFSKNFFNLIDTIVC